jgi:hypothetical protein
MMNRVEEVPYINPILKTYTWSIAPMYFISSGFQVDVEYCRLLNGIPGRVRINVLDVQEVP